MSLFFIESTEDPLERPVAGLAGSQTQDPRCAASEDQDGSQHQVQKAGRLARTEREGV